MDDRIARLWLKDGTAIDIFRQEDTTVKVCREDRCLILPSGTANQVMELVTLLEPMIDKIENEEESGAIP